ncbi:MAG: YadA-like family protein [Phascolarctobacterium sp.]|nr:YadA-like family protein [Phascolarctobacterium sp.]
MLKRRNLKVLAAAIGVSVMSGLYASPAWADSSLKDTGDSSDTNTQVIVSDANGVFLKHQGNAESGKLVSEVVVGNEGVSMTHNGSQLVVNDSGVSFNSGQDQSLFTIGTDGALNATSLNVGGQTLSADELSELKSKTTALSYINGVTSVNSSLNVQKDLGVQGDAYLAGNATVNQNLVVKESATVQKNLGVYGDTYLKDTNVAGDLVATGSITAAGDLGVHGDTYLKNTNVDGDLVATGSITAVSDLGVWGNTYLQNTDVNGTLTADTVTVSGNTTVGGTLEVTGATTLKDRLDVDKGASFANQNVKIEDDGRTTFKNTNGSETVINGGVLRNETVMTQRVEVGEADGDNTVTKGDGFYVKDGVNVVSKLTQDGLYVGKDKFTVGAETGDTTVGGTLDVTGKATFKDDAEFDKDVKVDGRLDVASGASIKKDGGGILNVTDDGVGLHSDNGNKSSLAVTKSGVGLISDTAISMNAADAKMSLSADGIGMHEGESAATVTDDGIGLTTEKTSVTVTDNGTTFVAVDKGTTEYTNINGDEVTVTDGTNKTIVNSTDVSITDPADSENRINLSDLGQIDNLDQELQARSEYVEEDRGTAVGAINAEAAIRREEVARLDNRIDKVEDRLDKVGAMTAAIANLRTMGYDPCAPSEFSMSLGHYRGETGMALGFFHYPNRDFMLSFSVSTAGDEYMGGIGATWKFGRKTPEQLAEEIKAKEAKKALAKAEAERKVAVAAKVRVQQAKHAEMQ